MIFGRYWGSKTVLKIQNISCRSASYSNSQVYGKLPVQHVTATARTAIYWILYLLWWRGNINVIVIVVVWQLTSHIPCYAGMVTWYACNLNPLVNTILKSVSLILVTLQLVPPTGSSHFWNTFCHRKWRRVHSSNCPFARHVVVWNEGYVVCHEGGLSKGGGRLLYACACAYGQRVMCQACLAFVPTFFAREMWYQLYHITNWTNLKTKTIFCWLLQLLQFKSCKGRRGPRGITGGGSHPVPQKLKVHGSCHHLLRELPNWWWRFPSLFPIDKGAICTIPPSHRALLITIAGGIGKMRACIRKEGQTHASVVNISGDYPLRARTHVC